MFKNPLYLFVVSLSRCTGVIFEQTQVHFFFDGIKTQLSQPQLHKEESLFFVKGMLMGSLLTDGVSDDDAQELQMPIVPQAIKRCGETLAISSCNAQRSRHSSSNRAGSAESDTFPESALVQSVRRITRTRLSTSRTVKKIDARTITSMMARGRKNERVHGTLPRDKKLLVAQRMRSWTIALGATFTNAPETWHLCKEFLTELYVWESTRVRHVLGWRWIDEEGLRHMFFQCAEATDGILKDIEWKGRTTVS